MTDQFEAYILNRIRDYFEKIKDNYSDSIGDDDYILTKIRTYDTLIYYIDTYLSWLDSL